MVTYPALRREVVTALRSLSDVEYQERVWVRQELPHPKYYDEFQLELDTLFNDIDVCRDPESWVGSVLYRDEVSYLRSLGVALDEITADDSLGEDEEFIADARWPRIVELAHSALSKLTENNDAEDRK